MGGSIQTIHRGEPGVCHEHLSKRAGSTKCAIVVKRVSGIGYHAGPAGFTGLLSVALSSKLCDLYLLPPICWRLCIGVPRALTIRGVGWVPGPCTRGSGSSPSVRGKGGPGGLRYVRSTDGESRR